MARRGTRATATLAALFVLHVPLCALACLDAAPEASVPAATEHARHPCHEVPDPAPADAPPSHADCDCERTGNVLVSQPLDATTTLAKGIVLPTEFRYARTPRVHWARKVIYRTDLPPPDILLRKSTLLL